MNQPWLRDSNETASGILGPVQPSSASERTSTTSIYPTEPSTEPPMKPSVNGCDPNSRCPTRSSSLQHIVAKRPRDERAMTRALRSSTPVALRRTGVLDRYPRQLIGTAPLPLPFCVNLTNWSQNSPKATLHGVDLRKLEMHELTLPRRCPPFTAPTANADEGSICTSG